MALSAYDKQRLSQSDQNAITSITDQAAKGQISWADANKQANAIRSSGGGYTGGASGSAYVTTGQPSASGSAYKPNTNNTVSAPAMNTGSGVDTNTDYQALINQAKSAGNLYAAAYYENLRNQKIASPGYTGNQTQTNLYQALMPQNLDSYVKQMYQAQTDSKLAALQSAYEQNRATLEAQGAQIAPTYRAQKNEAAGNAAVAQRSFNEVAAANGLNSGTSGQANLASGIALQGNLNKLNAAQAQAQTDNAVKLANLSTEYRNAIVQANSDGNSALASALYNEYQRYSTAMQNVGANVQSQYNSNRDYQLQVSENKQSAASENKKYAYETAMDWIQRGIMPSSSLLNSAGISAVDAQRYVAAVKMQQAYTSSVSSSKKKSSVKSSVKSTKKSSSSKTSSSSVKTKTSADVVHNAKARQASVNKTSAAYSSLGKVAKALYQQFSYSYLTPQDKRGMITQALSKGHITQADANYLYTLTVA